MGASSALMPAMMGMSAISSVAGAYSQYSAYKAKGAYDESVANTNAKISGLQADETLRAGSIAASKKNLETRQVAGAVRAAGGASGVDVSSGSTAATRISSDFAGNIDELTIRNNAARQAWGFKTQALTDTFQGQMEKMTATSQAHQTLITGGLNAIEGPLKIYANYKRWASRYSGGSGSSVPFDTSTSEWEDQV